MSNSSEHKTDDRNDKPPLWAFALAAITLVLDPSGRLQTHRVAEGEDSDSVAVRHDRSRGRAASTPSDIPAKGWKDILWRAYHNVSKHRVVAIAAGVTFYALLAIFPGIAALVAIYGLIADPSTIAGCLEIDCTEAAILHGHPAETRRAMIRLQPPAARALLAFLQEHLPS
jgi:hypothetical protein